jgi:hypothetical protein
MEVIDAYLVIIRCCTTLNPVALVATQMERMSAEVQYSAEKEAYPMDAEGS